MPAPLTQRLLAAVDPERRPPWLAEPDDPAALEAELAAAVALALSEAPLPLAEDDALAGLARVLDPEATLAAYRIADLALVERLAAGDPAALRHLQGPLFAALKPALRHLGIDTTTVGEVLHDLLAYLLVPPQAPPGSPPHAARILGYRGRGPLRRWLRTVAVRRAYRAAKPPRVSGDDAPLAVLAADDDAELVHLKRRYAGAFRDAFVAALADLSPRERNLLRFHHLDRLTVDDLGTLYQVHRATAARWLRRARDTLALGTREHLQREAGVASPTEAESLIRLVRSQLDLSLHRFLDGHDEPS